ncbi:MAG TPA: thiamine pyrophosphate-dependent enzyme [Myxococcales bacterium]
MRTTVAASLPRSTPRAVPRQQSISDALIGLLADLGVERAFGVIGGAIAPFFDALGKSRLKVHHLRHESGAAFAAVEAYFAGGRPTLAVCTSGPGLTNALTGMMSGRWDGAKVVLISGATATALRGRGPAQETSAQTMPYSGLFTAGPLFDYAVMVESPAELPQVAFRLASGLARPGRFVAHVSLPIGVQTAPAPGPLPALVDGFTAPGISPEDAGRIARLLSEGPFAIWVGFGARHASAEVRALAEKTGAPVMCTPRAKGIFPEGHPQFIGVTGLGGHGVDAALARSKPARILVLGTRLTESTCFWQESLAPPQGFVHVDLDPDVPGAAFQTVRTLAVQADVAKFLRALLPRLPARAAGRASRTLRLQEPRMAREPRPDGPVRPDVLLEAMQKVVVEGSDAVVLAESGNAFAWAIHALRFQEPHRFRVNLAFGAMGQAVTGVVGAALARPGKAVALVGDGAMLMNCELSAAAQYRAPAVWVVLNDGRYGMVAQGMAAQGFTPCETDFPPVDFVAVARAMGADGLRVEREAEVEPALALAMAARGPFVVDVQVDRAIPGPWMKRIQNLILQGASGKKA